jgi:hypothetical protein
MAESEAALFRFPEEKTVELEGTLMGTSAGRMTVTDSAALACYGVSDVDDIAVATLRLNDSAPLRPNSMPFPLRVVQSCIRSLYCVANHPRHFSGIARYPAIRDFASSLAQSQPSFAISSEKVHILSNPADFYTRLTVSH